MSTKIRQWLLIILVSTSFSFGAYACPVITSYDLTPATCMYSNDAVLTINATGTPTLEYSLDGVNFQASPTFTGLVPGTYIVTVRSGLPCTITDTVVIYSTSTVSSSLSVSSTDTLFVNEEFAVYGSFLNAVSWTLFMGDGFDTSNVSSVVYSYQAAGAYTVALVATDGVCVDTSSVVVVITGESDLLVSNVFTPNNDGVNDVWRPQTTGIGEMECHILNRYGEVVHEWSGGEGFWDGHSFPSGLPCPEGTYFYFLKATGSDGKSYEQHGTITLLR